MTNHDLNSHNPFARPGNRFAQWLGTPEMRLLLCACRSLLGADGNLKREVGLSLPFNAERFLKFSEEQRLVLVAFRLLVKPNASFFSPEVFAQFEKKSQRRILGHLRQGAVILALHQEFKALGLTYVFLKGPVLNDVLFENEVLRYSNDVDVLVNFSDVKKADGVLKQQGFVPERPLSQVFKERRLFGVGCKDLAYRKGHEVVELHWKTHEVESIVTHPDFRWDECVIREPFHGEEIPVLEDRHNALYLCLHAAKHNWSRLRWLLDIGVFVTRRKVEWRSLLDLAKRYQLSEVVLEAASLCERVFGLNVSDSLPGRAAVEKRLARRLSLMSDEGRTRWGTWEMIYLKSFIHTDSLSRLGSWCFFTWETSLSRIRFIKESLHKS